MDSAETPITFDFDIVERFPEEICRNVFSYLPVNELLSASLVSKDWYNLIGRAPECMAKLNLYFDNRNSEFDFWESDKIEEVLTSSTRKYDSIQISFEASERQISTELKDILEIRDRKWKKVDLSWTLFESPLDLFEVLSYIDRTVEELKLDNIDAFEETEIESCPWTFPKLKTLSVKCYRHCFTKYPNIFANCTTLKELALEYSLISTSSSASDDVNAIETHKMIKRNRDLKKLTIETDFDADYLTIDISEGIQCHLTSLSISFKQLNAKQTTNLQKFLQSQLTSLKRLSLRGWPGLEATKMIFHMPKLTHLKLESFLCDNTITDLKTAEFHRSTTVTDFKIVFFNRFGVNPIELDMLHAIFPLMPNVKHLALDFVNDEVLDVIAVKFPDLETLSTYNFFVKDVLGKDILKHLKQLSELDPIFPLGGNLNGHIRKSTSSSFHFAQKVDDMKEDCREKYLDSYLYSNMDNRRVQVRDLIQESKHKNQEGSTSGESNK